MSDSLKTIDEVLIDLYLGTMYRRLAPETWHTQLETGALAVAKTQLQRLMAAERLNAKLKQAEELELIFEDRNNALAKRFCHFLVIGLKDELEQLIVAGEDEG